VGADDRGDYASLKAYPEDPVRAVHDVVAMAYLTDPGLFTTETLPLRIVCEGPPEAAGQTLIDPGNCDHPAVEVITGLDHAAFVNKMVAYLEALG
jgi:inosine-uridine nucleoside N-ribohydrolase